MKGTEAKRNVCPDSCVSTGGKVPGCPGGVGAYGHVIEKAQFNKSLAFISVEFF